MRERASPLPATLINADTELAREFEARLIESSTLAFRVAYGVLRDREDAEDVAQEAFAKAYRRFRELRNRDRFRAWLVRMTWRLAIDRQRANRRRRLRDRAGTDARQRSSDGPGGAASGPTAIEELLAHERAQQLWGAIDALPGRLQQVIVLISIEGHDLQTVARLLDLPEGTVKSRLFAARRRLREQLTWTKA